MTINSLTNAATDYFQSLAAKQSASSKTPSNFDPSSLAMPQDSSPTLSPAAQMLNQLQQMQKQNPAQFQQFTAQIAAKLQSAAANAQSSGNTAQATQLNQLATQFQNASQTGQVPSAQSLQQAGLGGHHHGGHHHSGGSTPAQNQTDPLAPYQPQFGAANSTDPIAALLGA
jgi:hypothetical protein